MVFWLLLFSRLSHLFLIVLSLPWGSRHRQAFVLFFLLNFLSYGLYPISGTLWFFFALLASSIGFRVFFSFQLLYHYLSANDSNCLRIHGGSELKNHGVWLLQNTVMTHVTMFFLSFFFPQLL